MGVIRPKTGRVDYLNSKRASWTFTVAGSRATRPGRRGRLITGILDASGDKISWSNGIFGAKYVYTRIPSDDSECKPFAGKWALGPNKPDVTISCVGPKTGRVDYLNSKRARPSWTFTVAGSRATRPGQRALRRGILDASGDKISWRNGPFGTIYVYTRIPSEGDKHDRH